MFKKGILLILTGVIILSGCAVPSGPKQFENELVVEDAAIVPKETDALVSLEEAIDHTQSDVIERFWFRAHIANNIEKRRNTHMTVNGIVVRPHGYYMRNTLVTQPYEYYRWDEEVFIRQKGNWFYGREPELPFDIFYGFDRWKGLLGRAESIRFDDVLGVPTVVHEIELSGEELYALDDSLFHDIPLNENDHLTNILKNTQARALFYVGDVRESTDKREVLPIIYKYQVFIEMPIPGAGYMKQETQHFIFRVNLDSVEMTSIEDIKEYVIEIEDVQEMMELEEEMLEEKEEEK